MLVLRVGETDVLRCVVEVEAALRQELRPQNESRALLHDQEGTFGTGVGALKHFRQKSQPIRLINPTFSRIGLKIRPTFP
jgi:hypothetical protein